MLRIAGSRLLLHTLPAQQQFQPLIAVARSCAPGRALHTSIMCSNSSPMSNGQVRNKSQCYWCNIVLHAASLLQPQWRQAVSFCRQVCFSTIKHVMFRPVPWQAAPATQQLPHHQPYRLTGKLAESDWVQHLELDAARRTADEDPGEPLKVLVLYGSLRQRGFSKLLAYEFSRCV
jgi:hypothetical protein